jgi:hypothetical protein
MQGFRIIYDFNINDCNANTEKCCGMVRNIRNFDPMQGLRIILWSWDSINDHEIV